MSKLEQSSLYQLTMVRFRLFLREPEAIFWIFVFPILLAVGLGIAFRNRPADVLASGRDDGATYPGTGRRQGLTAATMNEADGTRALATGSILLLAIQTPDGVATNTTRPIPMRGPRAWWPIAQYRRRRAARGRSRRESAGA
jgi:ABC-2 type transport system permease protein